MVACMKRKMDDEIKGKRHPFKNIISGADKKNIQKLPPEKKFW